MEREGSPCAEERAVQDCETPPRATGERDTRFVQQQGEGQLLRPDDFALERNRRLSAERQIEAEKQVCLELSRLLELERRKAKQQQQHQRRISLASSSSSGAAESSCLVKRADSGVGVESRRRCSKDGERVEASKTEAEETKEVKIKQQKHTHTHTTCT